MDGWSHTPMMAGIGVVVVVGTSLAGLRVVSIPALLHTANTSLSIAGKASGRRWQPASYLKITAMHMVDASP